jgi:hypothetical protein
MPYQSYWRFDVRVTSLLHPVRPGQLLRAGKQGVLLRYNGCRDGDRIVDVRMR